MTGVLNESIQNKENTNCKDYSLKLQSIENNRDHVLFLMLWETGAQDIGDTQH